MFITRVRAVLYLLSACNKYELYACMCVKIPCNKRQLFI